MSDLDLYRKKLPHHLTTTSAEPHDVEDISLITDDDIKQKKGKDMNLFSWMYLNRVLLIMCSISAMLLVWHRWSSKYSFASGLNSHFNHHLFSDSMVDSHRFTSNLRLPEQQSHKQIYSESATVETVNVPQKDTIVTSSKGKRVPFDGCLTELPYPDTRKHIVPPPPGDVTIVCCNTTAGVLNIEVHPTWAPIGAGRFLEMVTEDFFSTQVPLFRALKGFLIQFGLAGDPKVHSSYHAKGNLKDDPTWLPLGPRGRSISGISRYQKGYLGYAGAGKNSRGTQLIVALAENKFLGGGCPWEVPWGAVFGEESLRTLDRVYTGYGEKVSQGKIMNRGIEYVRKDFPKVDVITSCKIVRENVPWRWQASSDNTNLNLNIGDFHVSDPKPEDNNAEN